MAVAPAAMAASDYATPYAFTTIAGIADLAGFANGQGTIALFNVPFGIAVDPIGNLYVADSGNGTVRKITASGTVTTFAGTVGVTGSADGTGAAAQFGYLVGAAVDTNGNVYVSDAQFNTIRKITPTGVVTTLAGSAGNRGHADGTGTSAQFNQPNGLGVDAAGNVYVADSGNDTIRKITPAGVVSTLAGSVGVAGHADGTGTSAQFNSPAGLTSDSSGNLYEADQNDTIRRITPAGVVSTLAGIPGIPGSNDGTGIGAQFNNPAGLAIDPAGNVYVTDSANDTIRMVTPGGVVTTLAGRVGVEGGADGTGTTALFNTPIGVTVDGSGNLYVADSFNDTIRKGAAAAPGSSPPRLVNLSTRAQVGTGANILIPGFVVAGPGMETLLIRADGPSLIQFGVTGVLSTPSLNVFDSSGNLLASNTGWNNSDPRLAAAAASVGAFPFAAGSADCALILTLPAGGYTAQVSGVGGTTGVALAEVYEMSSTGTRLSNLSVRAQVGTGDDVVIPGFYISGSGTESLLIRADGPVLSQYGVDGVLSDPVLRVIANSDTIDADTQWGTNLNADDIAAAAAVVGAFPLPVGSADSATLISLSPGSYTVEVSGVNNETGVALAEIYELP
jgi:sugar lactone lactonase YvrE